MIIEDLYFATPELLWALPAAIIIGSILTLKRSKNRLYAATRLFALCLMIIAAANPYFSVTHSVSSDEPSITIIDDKTASMNVFDPGVAERISSWTKAPMRSITGDSTPLGDRIVQYSLPGTALLLVSDGNSNSGRALSDALALMRASNATAFAISLAPERDDASVELSGTNTAVLAGDYPFKAVVRSARGYEGTLAVYADDEVIYSDTITANTTASIKISHSFLETGNHLLRAEIAHDEQPANDLYQKSIYVVPKPDVLLISSISSPLAVDLNGLYKLTIAPALPSDLKGYKAVVLDNVPYDPDLDRLGDYVREGGGLLVVGGEEAYDLGGYRGSGIERFLPVRSVPSIFEGGKTVIFILDISFSLLTARTKDGTSLMDYEKALAVELLKSPDLQDYKAGLIVFGSRAYDVLDPVPMSRAGNVLSERISSLAPAGTENSYLDNGLDLAWDMLNASGGQGELIVFSDGNLYNYPEVVQRSIGLLKNMNVRTRLIQVQAFSGMTGKFKEIADQTGSDYSEFVYPQTLFTNMQEPSERPEPVEEALTGYAATVVNKNHYITREIEINASVTGWNDVTPRPGAARLVALADGKPLLTVWRYGLGRVAALSADDGLSWAGQLYEKENSELISSTVNWAIGDPRPQEELVEAGDGWQGTPLTIAINSASRPLIDGVEVEKVGDSRYTATFTPNSTGIYRVGSVDVAVNYPMELLDIGVNPELSKLIMAGGGRVFTEAEAKRSLISEAEKVSSRTVQERISERDLLLATALLIILIEILYRKSREMKGRGRSKA